MYAIVEGEVELFITDKPEDSIGPGAKLGELGLIDRRERTAREITETDCRLVPIGEARFDFLIQNKPNFALWMMCWMARRIRLMRLT